MILPITILQAFSKRDDDKDCSGENSDSQMCQTGTTTSTTTIVLAVVLPVCALAIGLGFMTWKGYQRNKKEVLDDADDNRPDNDYIGENNVQIPDYLEPDLKKIHGGPYYNPSANNSSNPFKDPNEK
ncbi:unnamed protein product [Ambrosiozyma monospora]|uniref:Unnamed protein product n=1 Tax=Ambrosiozyma monospora TaxID=43982 RepID=A0A9W6YNN9_AMBMO|nr:unnamed protein product [Ambrosiozyma monospora]